MFTPCKHCFGATKLIKVSVPSMPIRNMSGIGRTSGKSYNMDFQTVYVHVTDRDGKPAPFPEKTEIILTKNDQGVAVPYAPGEYQLHPASIYVDRTGNLAVAPRLAPLTARS